MVEKLKEKQAKELKRKQEHKDKVWKEWEEEDEWYDQVVKRRRIYPEMHDFVDCDSEGEEGAAERSESESEETELGKRLRKVELVLTELCQMVIRVADKLGVV